MFRRQLCQKLTLFPSVGAGDAMIPIASRAGMSAARSIPIIAVTSYALSREEKKARAAGCVTLLQLRVSRERRPY